LACSTHFSKEALSSAACGRAATPTRLRQTTQNEIPRISFIIRCRESVIAMTSSQACPESVPVLMNAVTNDWRGTCSRNASTRDLSPSGQFYRHSWSYPSLMRMETLTRKQPTSIPCPICGVAAGLRCLLHSGGPRSEPHLDRKLRAVDEIERNRICSKISKTRVTPS
jgi:hypothetical protein